MAALKVETNTWVRDSHDLFDYESSNICRKRFYLSRPGRVFRSDTEISIVCDGLPLPPRAEYLFSIKNQKEPGKYIIHPAEKNLGGGQIAGIVPKKLWTIVRHLPEKHYVLQENDIVKLGRFKLRVKQLVGSNGDDKPLQVRLDESETQVTAASPEEVQSMQCRICLLEGHEESDPLICPCQCKGSIKFVHAQCLRRWVDNKMNEQQDNHRQSYFFRQSLCELCKTAFPERVTYNSEKIQLISMPTASPPFMVLENMAGASQRGVHIIPMSEMKQLKLGRGHESDVRIPDVSISRCHASIHCSAGQFLLRDNNSKFGTLVAMRRAHSLEESHVLAVQVGRSMVMLSVDKNVPTSAELIDASDDLTIEGSDGFASAQEENKGKERR